MRSTIIFTLKLCSMFPRGQNYANLCQNPPVNLNVKVTQKLKSENLLRDLPLLHAENLPTK